MLRLLLLSISLIYGSTFSFITLGDWGGEELGSYHPTTVKDVAKQMGMTAASSNVSFIVNVGDNFYYCGIQNTSDQQIQADFENIYTADSLNVPWYSVLGNHDYGYNVEAQVGLNSTVSRWVMDGRYYTRRVPISSGSTSGHITFIFLDSNPCVQDYVNDDPSNWDPCGTEFPTCDPVNEGKCRFHQNILTQSCSTQYTWLKETLQAVPKSDWLIVVAHHPADQMNVEDMASLIQQHGFDLYLNGHTHTLAQYQLDGDGAYVTSGAGAMVDTADQERPPSPSPHSFTSVFNQKTAGFTRHTFSEDLQTLTTDWITYAGQSIHSFTVKRGVSPSPGPGPGPSPSTCAQIGCGVYKKSNPCQCNSECDSYKDCCPDYEQTCGHGPSPSPSCASFGCGTYKRSNPCQCNSDCDYYDDCCSDYSKVCGHGGQNSCEEIGCHTPYNPENKCQCNDACKYHDDCCSDFYSLCDHMGKNTYIV